MRTLATIIGIIAPATAFATNDVTNNVFVSGPLILLFLGFCALVVVIQCVPAITMLYGMFKGIRSVVKDEMATTHK
ncbi:MAG: hypothetical protein PHD54_01895 [Desulfuromonadaceae bacterium]|nr:hypothetical protein [Desulfuromonadaceae bacterium]